MLFSLDGACNDGLPSYLGDQLVSFVLSQKACKSFLVFFLVFRPETDLMSLLMLFFSSYLGDHSKKSLRHRPLKSDRDEILQNCSSHRLTESDFRPVVTFSRWRP